MADRYAFKCKVCNDWHLVDIAFGYGPLPSWRLYEIRCPQREDAIITGTYSSEELKPISGTAYYGESEDD